MWTADEICEYYDSHLSVTIAQIARMSGWPVADVKQLLLLYDIAPELVKEQYDEYNSLEKYGE
jgi:hypothetical protein